MSIWVCHWHFLPSVRKDTDAEMLFFLAPSSVVLYRRTLQAKSVFAPSQRRITVVRRASYSVRVFPALCFSLSWLIEISDFACARMIVYDVSNRESFEALPRWLEELENYVPPEVVKIVVGNKLDKVRYPRV